MNEGSMRLLQSMLSPQADEKARRLQPITSSAPTLILIEDPLGDVETVLGRSYDEEHGQSSRKAPNGWLAKRGWSGLTRHNDIVKIQGRGCCIELAKGLDRRMHVMEIPSRHVCPGCGATWAVEMRAREERKHGR